MPIYMTARYKVRRVMVDKCKQTLADLARHVKLHEPKIKVYLALQEVLDPASFLHVIIFEDEAALQIHQNSKASERFVKEIYPEALEPIEFMEYNVVGSNLKA